MEAGSSIPARPRPTKAVRPYHKAARDAPPPNALPTCHVSTRPLALTFGQSEKLSPHEQLALAFGFENLKPPPIILSE